MMKVEIGGKYICRCDLDINGNVVNNPKDVMVLSTTLKGVASVCYQRDGDVVIVGTDGRYLFAGSHPYDLLPYPEPPKYIPFDSINDIPFNARIKRIDSSNSYIITAYAELNNRIMFDGSWYSLSFLLEHFEFSTDCGKTWSKCGKVA